MITFAPMGGSGGIRLFYAPPQTPAFFRTPIFPVRMSVIPVEQY